MSRFVICGDWVLDPKVGVQRYAAQLLRELDLRVKAGRTPHRFELLVPEEAEQIPTLSAIPAVRRGSAASKLSRYFWQQKVFPAYARVSHAMGIDLALALPVRGCRVSAVHDCIVESFPENFSDHRLYALSYRIRVHAATSDPDRVILTVSETSRKEIERRYPKSRGRIRVVSDGWEHMQRIEEDDSVFRRLGIDPAQPYFFSLGSRYRHKNIEWVLGAAVRNPHALFVITGANLDHKEQERLDGARRSNVRFTGYVSDAMLEAVADADLLVLEANHDVNVLQMGPYPYALKRRILSEEGHLSNEAAAACILRLHAMKDKPRRILLAHLSHQNNTPEMARVTVSNMLEEEGLLTGGSVLLDVVTRDEISPLYEV